MQITMIVVVANLILLGLLWTGTVLFRKMIRGHNGIGLKADGWGSRIGLGNAMSPPATESASRSLGLRIDASGEEWREEGMLDSHESPSASTNLLRISSKTIFGCGRGDAAGAPPVWETTANGRGLTTTIQDLDDNRSAAAAGQARSDSPSGEVVWGSVSVSEDLE